MTYTDHSTTATSSGSNTITAFFDDRAEADQAVSRLEEAGISRSSIRVIADGSDAGMSDTREHKGFWASLADMFMPDDDRNVYAEGIRRGGYLVTVSGYPFDMHDKALDILDDEGSVDLDERAKAWESEGWSRSEGNEIFASSGFDKTSGSGLAGGTIAASGSTRSSGAGRSETLNADGEEIIPVVEEELRVGKRDVNNGRVRVRSYVTERPVQESVSLRDENVEVTRRAVNRPVDGTEAAFVDRTIEAEEHREEAVISKDARVVEEISLRKTAEQREETVSDTVRKTEVEVDDDRTGTLRRDDDTPPRRI